MVVIIKSILIVGSILGAAAVSITFEVPSLAHILLFGLGGLCTTMIVSLLFKEEEETRHEWFVVGPEERKDLVVYRSALGPFTSNKEAKENKPDGWKIRKEKA